MRDDQANTESDGGDEHPQAYQPDHADAGDDPVHHEQCGSACGGRGGVRGAPCDRAAPMASDT
jgi:hypothetical protein